MAQQVVQDKNYQAVVKQVMVAQQAAQLLKRLILHILIQVYCLQCVIYMA
jgi:hypothetical protein